MIRFAPPAIAFVLSLAVVFWAHGKGYEKGQADAFAEVERAQFQVRVAFQRAEAARLAAQSARDRLAQELEDQANAAPVAYPACLDPDRVRRLNALR